MAPDPYNLRRFVDAQDGCYARVLGELRAGEKRSHWMWFVFPQLAGLGRSPMAEFYALQSADEARAYFGHPVLGARLLECTGLVNAIEGRSIHAVFGSPDDLKFRSCMTLFRQVAPGERNFKLALERHFAGKADERTLELLAGSG